MQSDYNGRGTHAVEETVVEERRQFVKYNFYRVDPAWRRLGQECRRSQKKEFAAVVAEHSDGMVLRSYSLVGLRADADLLLWLIAEDVEELHGLAAQLNQTALAGYMDLTHSYFALTRRSPYLGGHRHAGQEGTRSVLRPSRQEYPYLIVYPFLKTHDWYQLPKIDRQRMMGQHFAVGHKYPGVRINTTYSYGLDDQEHVVSFETADLGEFLELVMDLRESAARPYTLRDTPIFTCLARPLGEALDALG